MSSEAAASPVRVLARRLAPWLLLTAATLFFLAPMFAVPGGIASGDAYRDNDWLNCRAFDAISRASILEHGQLPLRSHLVGGGFPMVAHPSDGSWAPTILAVLLLGNVLGVKVNLVLFFLAGVFGVFLLARRWLELPLPAALLAALTFGFSAWAPSMMLVGFYHQAFYLLLPLILHLFLGSRGRPHRLLWAGLLLCLVLQQGGHAFAVVCYFLGVAVWLLAARGSGGELPVLNRWGLPLAALILITGTLALAKGLRTPPYSLGSLTLLIPLAATAVVMISPLYSGRMMVFFRCLLPWAGRLAALIGVGALLGAGRIAGLLHLWDGGRYGHSMGHMRYWFLTDTPEMVWTERFYEGGGSLLRGVMDRVPQAMTYSQLHGQLGPNADHEYAFLGLTLAPLLLAMLALFPGSGRRPRRRVALLMGLGLYFTLICLGWFLPPDFHFLLAWGLPWLGELGQPIKYYNFFILLSLVLLAGVGAARLSSLKIWGAAGPAVAWALLAVTALPLLQNRPILGELFARAVEPPARAEPFYQVGMVARAELAGKPPSEIKRENRRLRLRELRRPLQATEYFNVLRGVGTVDWYGTVTLPEHAVPRRFITPDGERLANASYRGEAQVVEGQGEILGLTVTPNTIQLEVRLHGPGAVVINQNHLPGFVTSKGKLGQRDGLLQLTLPTAGRHKVRLDYRPAGLMTGLALSALSLLVWLALQAWLLVRQRRVGQ